MQYPELVKLEVADPTPSRELWMLMHPSYREVRRIEIVANWLAGTVQGFLGSANNPPDNAEATR